MFKITNSHTGRTIKEDQTKESVVAFIQQRYNRNADDRVKDFLNACKHDVQYVFDSKHFWVSRQAV